MRGQRCDQEVKPQGFVEQSGVFATSEASCNKLPSQPSLGRLPPLTSGQLHVTSPVCGGPFGSETVGAVAVPRYGTDE